MHCGSTWAMVREPLAKHSAWVTGHGEEFSEDSTVHNGGDAKDQNEVINMERKRTEAAKGPKLV